MISSCNSFALTAKGFFFSTKTLLTPLILIISFLNQLYSCHYYFNKNVEYFIISLLKKQDTRTMLCIFLYCIHYSCIRLIILYTTSLPITRGAVCAKNTMPSVGDNISLLTYPSHGSITWPITSLWTTGSPGSLSLL